jgi:hypothetical protein
MAVTEGGEAGGEAAVVWRSIGVASGAGMSASQPGMPYDRLGEPIERMDPFAVDGANTITETQQTEHLQVNPRWWWGGGSGFGD